MSFEAYINDLILIYDLVRWCMIMSAGGWLEMYDMLKDAMMDTERVIQWMALTDAWMMVL